MASQWDPDRYDLLSDFRIFAVSWCLWDYSEHSCVVLFSFLSSEDLYIFCCSTYCIYIDFRDIFEETNQYIRSLRNHEQ